MIKVIKKIHTNYKHVNEDDLTPASQPQQPVLQQLQLNNLVNTLNQQLVQQPQLLNQPQQPSTTLNANLNEPQQFVENYTNIASSVNNLMVNVINSLQETFKNFNQTCPDVEVSSKNSQSPITHEALSVLQAIQGFVQGQADATKPDTITAGFNAFANISKAISEFSSKVQEEASKQPASTPQNPVTDSYHYSNFGTILNEKLETADAHKFSASQINDFDF